MFDFMFGSLRDALNASQGLLELLRDKLQGKRFVYLAGNHDHYFVRREAEELLGLEFATGKPADDLHDELRRTDFFRRMLERKLAGVEVDIRYPTYTFAGVLCTHGHYLDFHARRSGAAPGRLLARALWSIAVGGQEHAPTISEYEATITLLTSLLYTIAQLPNGTHAQRRAFVAFATLERAIRLGSAPARALEGAGDWVAAHVSAAATERRVRRSRRAAAGYRTARAQEAERRRRTGSPAGGEAASHALARMVNPGDSAGPAVEAIDKVVANLGWARDTDKVVFAHTHQPLDGVTASSGTVRYWNTGSWIYEPPPDESERYVERAWPGTGVLIDTECDSPMLVEMLARGELRAAAKIAERV